LTAAELQALHRAGEAVVPVDAAEPWQILHVSRATFYRAMQRGEVPGVLRLGRRRLLRLDLFISWVSGPREAATAAHHGRGQCATQEPAA